MPLATTPLSRSLAEIRAEFPGLLQGTIRLDGAAGTLAPRVVVSAVAEALRFSMANLHGAFPASVQSARRAIADLLGGEPDGVVLGPNMTTLTFHLADALSADWTADDEVI